MSIVPFGRKLYEAVCFSAGAFSASGTLCGHIDFTGPFRGTVVLSPDEALDVIAMLQRARTDVLNNSDPLGDPRLIWKGESAPMSMLFNPPSAPPPPPPPPAPPNLAQASILEQGAAAEARIAGAEGAGFNGTDVTGGQGAAAPSTTKSTLGG